MALHFQALASGSKGNAILIGTEKTWVLLDAGLSMKELNRRLACTPASPKNLDAIVISHEHHDHIRGLGPFSRKTSLPVYLSQGTLDNLPVEVGEVPQFQLFTPGTRFVIGDLTVHPFAISHDAGEPAGFVFEHNGFKLGVCTDLGMVTELVKSKLCGCQGLIVEANHDMERLLNGPYPWPLKQRIRSRHGHLCNSDTFELLASIHNQALQVVMFAHLSETNNSPDLVMRAARERLQGPAWSDVTFEIASQHEASHPIILDR